MRSPLHPAELEILRATSSRYEISYVDNITLSPVIPNCSAEGYKEVALRISNGRIKALYAASEASLEEIPTEWGDLTYLISLRIKGRNRSSLPRSFQNLTHIEAADFENIDLSEMMSHIWQWSSMEYFSAQHCRLTDFSLPPKSWRRVEDIDLSHNSIAEIPKWIVGQKSVRYVDFGDNRIQDLEVLTCHPRPRWVWLNISKNPIQNFDSLANVYRLYHLESEENRLTELPLSFFKLNRLKTLMLQGNCLDSLPAYQKGIWVALEAVDLGFNRFSEIPPLPFLLPKIKGVDLTGNPFSRESEAFLRFGNCWTSNRMVSAPPEDFVYEITEQVSKISEVIDYFTIAPDSLFDRIYEKIRKNAPLSGAEKYHPDFLKIYPLLEEKCVDIQNTTMRELNEARWARTSLEINGANIIL